MGLEQNEDEGLKYFEKAAEGGHLPSLHNLGCRDNENGEHVASMNHWRLAASGGLKPSMDNLIAFFEAGLFHHSDLSKTLQAFYRARAEVRSEHRDQHIKGLKSIGKYKEEYEW
jgi:TPR repeat protein